MLYSNAKIHKKNIKHFIVDGYNLLLTKYMEIYYILLNYLFLTSAILNSHYEDT